MALLRRFLLLAVLAIAATFATSVPAHARPSLPERTQKPAKRPPPPASAGYDVSYPQCSSTLPSRPDFGIVGVNGGRAYAANPCLAAQYGWAQTSTTTAYPKLSFYAN